MLPMCKQVRRDRLTVNPGGCRMKRLGSRWIIGIALGSLLWLAMAGRRTTAQQASATHTSKHVAHPKRRAHEEKPASRRERPTSTHRSRTEERHTAEAHRTSGKARRRTSASGSERGKRGSRERSVRQSSHAPKATAESRRLSIAFTASEQLRPMAQQLIVNRTPAAYAGVIGYAAHHQGEAAASAELALGHAYMLDRRYGEAEQEFHQASVHGTALDDYAEYLEAQAAVQGNRPQDAVLLLNHFADRHPDSVFDNSAPILLANAYLAGQDASGALRILQPLIGSSIGNHVGFR